MSDKPLRWLSIAREIVVAIVALAGLFYGLRADNAVTAAALNKHEAVQAITDAAQNARLDRLERIAERQDELIRSLDRLVAKLDRTTN